MGGFGSIRLEKLTSFAAKELEQRGFILATPDILKEIPDSRWLALGVAAFRAKMQLSLALQGTCLLVSQRQRVIQIKSHWPRWQ